jgi:hypothetical protein
MRPYRSGGILLHPVADVPADKRSSDSDSLVEILLFTGWLPVRWGAGHDVEKVSNLVC